MSEFGAACLTRRTQRRQVEIMPLPTVKSVQSQTAGRDLFNIDQHFSARESGRLNDSFTLRHYRAPLRCHRVSEISSNDFTPRRIKRRLQVNALSYNADKSVLGVILRIERPQMRQDIRM